MHHVDLLIARLAQEHLHIETLEQRRSDPLDFHDVAVWSVSDALRAAFAAGVEYGMSVTCVSAEGQHLGEQDLVEPA